MVLAIQNGQESKIMQIIDKFQELNPDFINTPVNKVSISQFQKLAQFPDFFKITPALRFRAHAHGLIES